jgi:hypothetical protein
LIMWLMPPLLALLWPVAMNAWISGPPAEDRAGEGADFGDVAVGAPGEERVRRRTTATLRGRRGRAEQSAQEAPRP